MFQVKMSKDRIASMCNRCENGTVKTMGNGVGKFEPIDAFVDICPKCHCEMLIVRIREFQESEGNYPCFGTTDGSCDQYGCRFRNLCLRMRR